MPDIISVGSATVSSAANAVKTITLGVPAGVADGDELIAALNIQNTAPAMTAPGGWTLVVSVSDGTANGQVRVYRRLAASEPVGYTWTTDVNGRLQGVMRAYRNSDPMTPAFGSGQANAVSTTLTAPSQTTIVDRSVLVFCGGGFITDLITCSTYSIPLVEVVDQHLQFGQVQCYAEGMKTDGAGASGNKTCVLSTGEANIGVLIVLTPPVPTPPPGVHPMTIEQTNQTAIMIG